MQLLKRGERTKYLETTYLEKRSDYSIERVVTTSTARCRPMGEKRYREKGCEGG